MSPAHVQPDSPSSQQHAAARATNAGFSASSRVRSGAEFTRVFAQGKRISHPLLALHVLLDTDLEAGLVRNAGAAISTEPLKPSPGRAGLSTMIGTGARLGLAVSRKVDPHAVGRNRIKRALREEFRRQRWHLPPGAYVVVARPAARPVSGAILRATLLTLLQRSGALPPLAVNGTMPPPP